MIDTVVFASCEAYPRGDGDEDLVEALLAESGVVVEWVPWTQWSDRGILTVIRATWDYARYTRQFMEWLSKLQWVCNSVDAVLGNIDKRYLIGLQEDGVPIVPSDIYLPGSKVLLPSGEFVVKPIVGHGSLGVRRFSPSEHEDARNHAADLASKFGGSIVQPFIGSVAGEGELAFVFFDGKFSHCFRKHVSSGLDVSIGDGELFASESISRASFDQLYLDVAEHALHSFCGNSGLDVSELMYARVDIVSDDSRSPLVLEIEVIEPSLGLSLYQSQASRLLADSILRRLSSAN
jgi:glutathione synthase/RimK-type ligase-like ATP-grasp enzyme